MLPAGCTSFASGEKIIKYLGGQVCRTAIGASRILTISETDVSFRGKHLANGGAQRIEVLAGEEFVKRFLHYVLPYGLRAIRYHGFRPPQPKPNARTLHVKRRCGPVQPRAQPKIPLPPCFVTRISDSRADIMVQT